MLCVCRELPLVCSVPLLAEQLGKTHEALWILVTVTMRCGIKKKCRKGTFVFW